jgi:Protein of unknown function (DUF3224)
MSIQTSGTGAIEAWDEAPFLEIDDTRKMTRASIRYKFSGDWEGEATAESLMCYSADDAASYVGFEHFVGRIGERSGSFVVQISGTYDGTEARSEGEVVPGSGTGDFVGIRGRHTSVSTHDDYPNRPFTFEFDVE